jgi:hypothetical protein
MAHRLPRLLKKEAHEFHELPRIGFFAEGVNNLPEGHYPITPTPHSPITPTFSLFRTILYCQAKG